MVELSDTFALLEAYDVSVVVVGLGVLGLAALLHRFRDRAFSFPILALAWGLLAFAAPLGVTPPDPLAQRDLAVHLTEIGVIISLMGVGLKIDRLPDLRTWSPTWRLLAICMPLTIAGVAVLGWWMLGVTPAAAVLLGAALAPTDPVLAADVQVGEPEPEGDGPGTVEQPDEDDREDDPREREDELRFTLTSEAGLNDSLAFPFTYLALHVATEGATPASWLVEWLLVDVAYRIVVGAGVGVVVALGLAHVLLRLPVATEHDRTKAGVGALAGTLVLYGVTEVLGGYGFLAVFVGGLTIRHRERTQQSHKSLHVFADQSEQLLMTGILVALGGAIAGGLLAPLTWQAALLGCMLVFVVRPAAGMIGLRGERRLSTLDRGVASFFGIRGIGSLYYLAYGIREGSFVDEELLWATCAFTVALSIVVHGIAAAPVMQRRDRHVERTTSPPSEADPP